MTIPRLSPKLHISSARVVTLALAASVLCLAQTSTPQSRNRNQITITTVKSDMINEWVDLQKNEVIPALKKAGVTTRTVLATTFGTSFEAMILTPLDTYSLLDGQGPLVRALGAEAANRLNGKLAKCIASQRTYISTRADELSLLPDSGVTPLVRVRTRFRTQLGKSQDFENIVKTDALPAYKKAKADGKIAGLVTVRFGAGANALDRVLIVEYSKFAEMDAGNPLVNAMGQDAFNKLAVKLASTATLIDVTVQRRIADLSF